MKKIFLGLLLAVTTFTVALAQDSTAKAAKHKAGAVKTNKKPAANPLNLTKEQQAKLKANNKEFKAKTQKVKGDTTLTLDQRKAKLKELNKEKKKENSTVLTPEQKAKQKQQRKDRKAGSPQNGKPSPKTAGTAKR